MALNKNVKQKIEEKSADNTDVQEAIIKLLKGVDEGKQLKRILEPILKTI